MLARSAEQLHGVHPHQAVNNRWPLEAAVLKRFQNSTRPTAIPGDNLHPSGAPRGRPSPRPPSERGPAPRWLTAPVHPRLPEVHRSRRNVNHDGSGSCQHERVQRKHKQVAQHGLPRISTRAPRFSALAVAACGDTEGSAAAASNSLTRKARTIKQTVKAANTNCLKVPGAASHAPAVADGHGGARYLLQPRPFEAFGNSLCFQIIRPMSST